MGNAARDNNQIPTLLAVSNADGSTPVTLYADPTTHRLLVSTIAITLLAATGAVNDTNTAFTFTSQPSVIVINGAVYQQTGGAITWTWADPTATLSVAVGSGGSIFGIL